VGWNDDIAEIGKMLDMASTNKEALEERIQTFASLVNSFSQVMSFAVAYELMSIISFLKLIFLTPKTDIIII
jgi:hypothetical protein